MHVRSVCGVLLGLLCLASPTLAQNLVPDGDFGSATQLGSWSPYGTGTAVWDGTQDAGGLSPASGSAHLTLTSGAAQGTVVGIRQCVDISGQAASVFHFFVSGNGPASQSSESRALMEVAFFLDTACTTPLNVGEGLGADVSAIPQTGAPWQLLPAGAAANNGNEGTATRPGGAQGLLVTLFLEATKTLDANQVVWMDTAVVHAAGATPITLRGFTAE